MDHGFSFQGRPKFKNKQPHLAGKDFAFTSIVNQPVYLKSFVAHSFTVCHAVLGEDREFDDKAAANWLKYAAMLRPSAK